METPRSTIAKNNDGNLVWSNGITYEKSPRRTRPQPVHEYINPVARALNDNETWTIGDQGEFCPTIPHDFSPSRI